LRKEQKKMGMHSMEELFIKWQHGDLTAEQMVGQLMQHMAVLYERLRLVERRVGSMAAVAATAPPTHTGDKKKG
jgi:uncharacterized coiled-coil protein SlyX